MNVSEYLKKDILLFDGAMGTYLAVGKRTLSQRPEEMVLREPEAIKRIHEEYLEAGAKAIKTNTFAANRLNYSIEEASAIIRKGYEVALAATEGRDAFVFADIGPVDGEESECIKEYQWVAKAFLDLGAENFLFETNSSVVGLLETASYIKSCRPDAFILVSFAVLPDGFTSKGEFASVLLKTIGASTSIDAFGLNCAQGSFHMLERLKKLLPSDKTLAAMPNAGYPIVVGHKTVYQADPNLFAESLVSMADLGVRILGGCCGTTPLHTLKTKEALLLRKPQKTIVSAKETNKGEDTVQSPFWEKLQKGEKVIAVELDPPENASAKKFMKGAQELKEAGIDVLTIADCPIARSRMDSSLLACKVKRELELDVLPHMTCRDRNLNATKALLLGLYAEDVRNVLVVTGDPIPTAERNEVKSVYQFNSRRMASFIAGLEGETLPTGFHLFGALNVNAVNFDVQLKLAKDKLQNGMCGFLTQPVLTERAVENLKRARAELDGYILGGLIPIVSERNARFMDSEINGISVDPKIIEAYVGKNREESEALAVEITTRIASEIAPYVDGYYFMTPFQRTSLIVRIIQNLH